MRGSLAGFARSVDPGLSVREEGPFVSDVLTPAAAGFSALGLDSRLADPLTALGYTDPTPVQREAIPPLLMGRDVIGLAATGTGKTAAFALPLLHRLAAQPDRKRPAAIVLVPTRELCMQVAAAIGKYGKAIGVRVVPVYGGAGFGDQARGLRTADVVVATPGRALDHLRRGTLVLDGVSIVVLDEADEMLDMGFADDLDAILSATPKERQTALFSATMPPRIAAIAGRHLSDPVRVAVAKAPVAAGEAPKVRQVVYVVSPEHKVPALVRVLDIEAPASCIVFCRTRHEADHVAEALASRGHRPQALHGGLSQEQRDRVMKMFRDGAVTLLVATDVAARGLDIGHLSHVVNFGAPQAAETYVHRVGRVGRAGREGVALTVADARERRYLSAVERAVGRLEYGKVPTAAQLRATKIVRTREVLKEAVATGGWEHLRAVAQELVAANDPVDVVAAALALAMGADPSGDGERDIPTVPTRTGGPADRPRPSFPSRRPTRGMARVVVEGGRHAGIGPRDLVAVIEHEVGLGARDLGAIAVTDKFAIIEVPTDAADEVVGRLDGVRIRGRRVAARLESAPAGAR